VRTGEFKSIPESTGFKNIVISSGYKLSQYSSNSNTEQMIIFDTAAIK